jgi:hypothetical protein
MGAKRMTRLGPLPASCPGRDGPAFGGVVHFGTALEKIMLRRFAWAMWLVAQGAAGQAVIDDEEILAADRPEAWAMNYVVASTTMTAFGATPALGAGDWQVAADLGHIPRLSREQQQVGFGGDKAEDLNKSPVFGRLRFGLGLGGGFVAELGYTPPLSIDGTKPRDLFSLALGRRWWQSDTWSISSRIYGQHGRARGDITCPEDVAGPFDPEANPFGCVQKSDDRIALNSYGADLTFAGYGAWAWHATAGVLRTEPKVRVGARVFSVIDHSRLVARGVLPYFAIGIGRELAPRWRATAEVLHVPIDVQRRAGEVENDALTSLRLQLSRRFGD